MSATLKAFGVSSLDDRVNVLRRQVWNKVGGLRDPLMRQIGLMVTQHCPPRDDYCELKSVFDFTAANVRYTGDIVFKDTFQTGLRTLQYAGGDCLPLSTLTLRDDYALVALGDLRPGDRIMASGAWTQVQEVWATGEKPILALDLNNGSTLRCSPEHRVFLADGAEVRAEDVKVGQKLLTPHEAVPCRDATFGRAGFTDEDFAWLLGVYIADGWSESNRFAIAGRDGKPKEEQKRRVQAIMEKAGLGASIRWHERYLSVNDKSLAEFFATCGKHAPQKHVPALGHTRAQVESLLEGLRADAGIAASGTVVHGTTSSQLALQLRVLYRMLNQSTHIRRVDNHGGLGTNPIYRVTVRTPEEDYDRKRTAVRGDARVVSVREEAEEVCGDITTDKGMFWLPESDVMVHNCDDHSILNAVLAMENGFQTKFRITSNAGKTWDHIYLLAGVPKHNPKRWYAIDTTLGAGRFGVEPPRAGHRDFVVASEND